jgi:hypothetical protein
MWKRVNTTVLRAVRINEGMPMPIMRAETSTLLLIDFQAKLMPAIDTRPRR